MGFFDFGFWFGWIPTSKVKNDICFIAPKSLIRKMGQPKNRITKYATYRARDAPM